MLQTAQSNNAVPELRKKLADGLYTKPVILNAQLKRVMAPITRRVAQLQRMTGAAVAPTTTAEPKRQST